MSITFTNEGLTIQTFQDIYDERAASYRLIYGNDINLDPDSPDGQKIAIESQLELDIQSFALTLYQQLDPDFAYGQSQQRIMKLAGVRIRPASRSQADVTIITDRPISPLSAGFTVVDELGQPWVTLVDVELVVGSNTITLFSDVFGSVEAGANTIINIATFISGVLSVTNPVEATVGQEEEKEDEVRLKRNGSLELPTSSGIVRLYAAITRVNNVTDAIVYENDTDVTDSRGIPAHSLWVVVEGGAITDIAEVMALNKTGGKPMVGAVSGTYSEKVERADGSTFDYIHEMLFDRPVDVPLYIRLNVKRRVATIPIDDVLIKNKIAEKPFFIGVNALAGEMYELALNSGDTFIPYDLEISDDNVIFTDERIESGLKNKFSIDVTNITVTEI